MVYISLIDIVILYYIGNSENCEEFGWVNDGICDDVTNNIECYFDAGDCCGAAVITLFCNECICYNASRKCFLLILPEILASGPPLAAHTRPLGLERHLRTQWSGEALTLQISKMN